MASVLTLSILLVIAMLITMITALDIRRERSVHRDGLKERSLLLASGMNDLVANPFYFSDISSLEQIAGAVESHPDISYVRMIGPNGRLLVPHLGYDQVASDAAYAFGLKAFHSREPLLSFEGDSLAVASPVRVGDETVGVVQFGFEPHAVRSQIWGIVGSDGNSGHQTFQAASNPA